MIKITVKLFYNLKERAGTDQINLEIPAQSTILDLKLLLIGKYPALESHLNNIMILINQKIALDEDQISEGAQVSFLTPIGGG
jgi:molybdopterin converting factor small subunit